MSNARHAFCKPYVVIWDCMGAFVFGGLRGVVCSLMFAMVRLCYTECYRAVRRSFAAA